jgi:serine/threonine-protein kinase haspin
LNFFFLIETGSDNDCPDIFTDEQLYLVLELGNAGTALESYKFSTAKQALCAFKQVIFYL